MFTWQAAKTVGSKYKDKEWPKIYLEDVNTALIAKEEGIAMRGFPWRILSIHCVYDMLATHYATPKMFIQYYNNTITNGRPC